jgi:hypothetical protein
LTPAVALHRVRRLGLVPTVQNTVMAFKQRPAAKVRVIACAT